MSEKLYSMELKPVPHSSIVGRSMMISTPGIGVVAQLMISVPQPHLDYKTVADALVKALMNGHVSGDGVTLVLPDTFGKEAR